jgi:hypothetical protein
MKNMKKLIILIAVLVGVTNFTIAKERKTKTENPVVEELDVKPLNGLRFILKLDNVDKKALIEIKDANGVLYHSEFASKNQPFVKVFDLSNLPDGEINFRVTYGKEVLVKSFMIETEVTRSVSGK